MNVIECLRGARDILARDGAWTRGAFARDNLHRPCSAGSGEAVTFCAIGACQRVVRHLPYQEGSNTLDAAITHLHRCAGMAIDTYNDMLETKRDEVVGMFDCAIERAETKGVSK